MFENLPFPFDTSTMAYLPALLALARSFLDFREKRQGWAITGAIFGGLLLYALIGLAFEPPEDPEQPVQRNPLLLALMLLASVLILIHAFFRCIGDLRARRFGWAALDGLTMLVVGAIWYPALLPPSLR